MTELTETISYSPVISVAQKVLKTSFKIDLEAVMGLELLAAHLRESCCRVSVP